MHGLTLFIMIGIAIVALVICLKILAIFVFPSSKVAKMRDEEAEREDARREAAIKQLQERQAAARDPRHQSEQLVRQDPKGAADALRRMMKH